MIPSLSSSSVLPPLLSCTGETLSLPHVQQLWHHQLQHGCSSAVGEVFLQQLKGIFKVACQRRTYSVDIELLPAKGKALLWFRG